MLKWSNAFLPANRQKNGNNNGNNNGGDDRRKNNNRDNNKFDGGNRRKSRGVRDYDNRGFTFEDDEEDTMTKSQQIMEDEDCLDAFIEDYVVVSDEGGNRLTKIINDGFWDACHVLTNYYNKEYKSILGKMNKVLDIMSTQKFTNALKIVCAGEDIKGWSGIDGIWKDVVFAISLALITTNGTMKEETIETYVALLTSEGLAGKDMKILVEEYALSKDLAIDLIIGIPVIPEDQNEISINAFHKAFILKLLDNAEENIDVLDAGTQNKLFTFFFGDERTSMKCIGKMLSATRIGTFKNDSQQAVYDEYVAMLAARLESKDIKEIKFVLRYVLEQKKERPRDEVVFDLIKMTQYDSIRKALFEFLGENPEYKKVIAN